MLDLAKHIIYHPHHLLKCFGLNDSNKANERYQNGYLPLLIADNIEVVQRSHEKNPLFRYNKT